MSDTTKHESVEQYMNSLDKSINEEKKSQKYYQALEKKFSDPELQKLLI